MNAASRIVLAMTLGVLGSSIASAGETDVEECARVTAKEARKNGFRLRLDDGDRVRPDQVMNYQVTLTGGLTYMFFACSDGSAPDVDIFIYDAEGNLVAHDETVDPLPSFVWKAPNTAEYIVRLQTNGSERRTAYQLGVMYKYEP